jgi:ATP-dependent RNA circularization protein (DNA/RNA ligase family)
MSVLNILKINEWIFTEKVDGTNIRIFWDGHKVTFGGRTENAQLPGGVVERLQELFLNNETEELLEQKFGENEVIFFGEGYGGKIQKGSGYKNTQDFILFDILVGETWLKREDVEELAKSFNLDVVPVVLEGTLDEAVKYVEGRPMSIIGENIDKEMEGLVGTPKARLTDFRGNRIIVKIKTCDF